MSAPTATVTTVERRGFPPAAPLLASSLVLVIIGGIWMAAYFPRRASLLLPGALGAGGAAATVTAFALLVRHAGFHWQVFLRVVRWAGLAYIIVAGLIEFAFVHNGARGGPLALVTVMLALFAVDVASIIAVTVAQYHDG
jgi:hypothetical protein